jgi:hypothetical protein
MLDEMKRNGFIEESNTPWSSHVLLFRKNNGDLRFCLYYRKLTDVTEKDCFPLPRNDDTLYTMGGAKWISTVYLKSGNCPVDIHSDDKEKLHSPQVRGYGISQSCPLASAILRRHLRGGCLRFMSCVFGHRNLDWPHVPRAPAQLAEDIRAVPRSPSRAKSGEVSSLAEGSTLPLGILCLLREYLPTPKIQSRARIANSEE